MIQRTPPGIDPDGVFFCWFTDGAPPGGAQVVWAEFGLLPVPRFKLLVYVYN